MAVFMFHQNFSSIMKKNIVALVALAAGLTGCQSTSEGYIIKGTAPVDAAANGKYVYLMQAQQQGFEKIDSVQIKDNAFEFPRRTPEDLLANALVVVPGEFSVPVILQQGIIELKLDGFAATGTPLNDRYSAYMARLDSLASSIRKRILGSNAQDTLTQADYQALIQEYDTYRKARAEELLAEHSDNALAILALVPMLEDGQIQTQAEVDALKARVSPAVLASPTIKHLLGTLESSLKTMPGQMFTDFDGVDLEGKASKLSDHVGKGHYTLVDFWASWCAPCRREMPHLIEIQKAYAPKGLKILGVAVWDEVEAHRKAVADEKITWPQIYNKDEAAGLYGVRAIPHMILFDPEGNIVARELSSETAGKMLEELVKTNGKL